MNTIKEFSSINGIDWDKIIPDINNDWINQRDLKYLEYTEISGEKDSVFYNQYIGVNSNRDAWVYGYSKEKMLDNVNRMIDNYNIQAKKGYEDKSQLDNDLTQIKWTSELQKKALSGVELHFIKNCVVSTFYRPFTKKWLYYNRELLHRPGKFDTKWGEKNLAIVTTGRSSTKDFSVLAIKNIPDINLMSAGAQTFLRYDNSMNESLLQDNSNVNELFAQRIGLSTDDTFTYVYGLLNSKEYQTKYANDLKKDLARIPIVKDKEKYVEIGKKLMELHLNYEEVPVYDGVQIVARENPSYVVKKMKFAKKRNSEGKLEKDCVTIRIET